MTKRTEQEIMQNWKGDTDKPVVSVCCITYNHEKYIEEAIDSFLMQETDFPFEIVIGEDCSTDGTKKIIDDYIKEYPKLIKLVTSESNVGMNANFNRTMKTCIGKYIALCEGDDYWITSKKLQIQIDEMKKYPEVNMSFHNAYYLNQIDNSKSFIKKDNFKGKKLIDLNTFIDANGGICPTPSLVFKRDILVNWFLSEDTVVGDYYLQIFGALKYPALFIDKDMCTRRYNVPSSWSDNQKQKSLDNMLKEIDIRLRDNRRLKEVIPKKYLVSLNLKYSKLILSKINILMQLGSYKDAREYLENIEKEIIKLNKKLYLLFLLKNNLGLVNKIAVVIRKIR
ncbi:MAG: glycosyltransferase [Campylobacterota bacterium]